MVFKLELSRTAQKALNKLPANAVKRIWVHLEVIKKDPYRPRPLADIVPVEGSAITYRLRIGRLRVEYEVYENDNSIKISNIFQKKRKSDYR
ncbi:MAG: type II toxin-antitoxin system RelE/ParE family toxin [Methanotrichaceae archaeon]|jgi:mRNA-degrading endonuclease RelE of RelBE toxin-antitoxin system